MISGTVGLKNCFEYITNYNKRDYLVTYMTVQKTLQ